MTDIVLPLLASLLYLTSAFLVYRPPKPSKTHHWGWAHVTSVVGLISHGVYVVVQLTSPEGINLNVFAIAATIALGASLIANAEFAYKPARAKPTLLVANLLVGIVMLASAVFNRVELTGSPWELKLIVHVLFSIAAYSVLAYAAVHGVLLLYLDRGLRNNLTSTFLQLFPPLESGERMLFNGLRLGVLLLTIASGTGLVFFWPELLSHPSHLHMVFTLIAWVLYTSILIGHQTLGWRGNLTTKLSLTSFVILIVGYFGLSAILILVQ